MELPTNYKEAVASVEGECWREAIAMELSAHLENGTRRLVKRNPDVVPVGSKWVFAVKTNKEGDVVRYKARMVAKGFTQQFCINYFETYAPVADVKSTRTFLSAANTRGYPAKQFDFEMAFPNCKLDEVVQMEVPNGVYADDDMVCELDKSLYGLKQAAQVWNKTIRNKLRSLDFKQSAADECIYVKTVGGEHVYVFLYVDDLIIAAPSDEEIEQVAAALAAEFKL